MPRRTKGGLGAPTEADVKKEGDLLDRVFGGEASPAKAPLPETRQEEASEKKIVGKYFKLSKDLDKQLKLYCVEHEILERDAIEKALKLLFEKE